MSEIRTPVQKRSIEKRNKIIEKGFELMCSQGYYNTNTSDIATFANVSTGIIYQYFKDKKEIFIEGIKKYSDHIMFPILDLLKQKKIGLEHLEQLLDEMLQIFIKTHTLSKKAHEEMIALSHLDDEIAAIFHDREMDTTNQIVQVLQKNGFYYSDLPEKVHIMIGIVENYCHEVVYHKHSRLDYNLMIKEVIHIIMILLNEEAN